MNTNVFRLLLLGSLFSLSACVQQSEVRQMKHSVSTLNQEMTQLNQETVKITQQNRLNAKSSSGVYLLPGAKTPARLESQIGTLRMSLVNITPDADGTTLTLRIQGESNDPLPAFSGTVEKSLTCLSLIGGAFSLILLLGASILVKISIGPGYDNAVIVLMIISPLPFLISLSNVYGIQVMLTHNYKKEFSKILIAAGLLSLLLIFPLTTLFKEIGAAITLLATECLVTSLMLMFVRNNKLLVC